MKIKFKGTKHFIQGIYIHCANIHKCFAYLFVLFCSIQLKMFLESIKINAKVLYYRLKTFLLFEKLFLLCSSKIMYQTCILLIITVINASAAVTLLEQRPEKNSGSEQDLNPRPLRCRCSALPTELSKPHESGRMRVSPLNVDVIVGPSIVE